MSLSDKWIDCVCRRARSSKTRILLSPAGAILYWVILGLFILASLWMDKFFRLPNPFSPLLSIAVSVPIFALGLSLPLWSVFYFIKTRGLSVLFNPPTRLVTAGPYAYSRNPMTVGIVMLLLGLGVLLGSTSLIFVFTPLFVSLNVLELRVMEEPELEKRFGNEYLEYKRKVPRFFLK
ncbi:MAG: isoprenylcysteine carboxylmethyltransferase family protein [Thermodesulfobacteriota bacterium]